MIGPDDTPAEPPAAADEPPVEAPTTADEPAAEEPSEARAEEPPQQRPAVGPRIIGMAPEPPAPPSARAAERRPRRRRPTAAERHRRAFFARLTELRDAAREQQPPAGDAAGEPTGAAPAVAATASPEKASPAIASDSAVEPMADADAAGTADPPSGRDQARLAAAIERVGGAEAVRQALAPKRDESGKPLKWAAVCCEAAQGLKPGDPVFAAWVRLAATPVRELKARVPDERPQRGGPGRGRGAGGRRDQRGPSGRGGRREDRDGGGRASREDMARHAYGGRVGAKIVIPGFEPPTDDDA